MRRPRSGKGAEGGRFAGSTNDPGPEKPGNSVEDKTLETGERSDQEKTTGTENPPLATVNTHLKVALELSEIKPGFLNNVSWEMESRGRKVISDAAMESNQS